MSLAAKFVLVILSTGVWLGLAILGWGGAEFFANPARTTLVIAMLAMAVVALFADGNISRGEREDRGNRWVLAVFFSVGLALGFVPAYTDRIGFWTIGGDTVRWFGVAICIAGGVLRLWPVFVLGRRFSGLVAIQRGHTLVTTGIYRLIRHPSYLGMLLMVSGWALAFRSGVGLILCALMIPPLVSRIRAEERLLASEFGDQYRAYIRSTFRLIPGIY